MFDFINDDERIIFSAFTIIAIVIVVGIAVVVLFVLKILTKFFHSRRKLKLAKAQKASMGRAEQFDVFISYSHHDEVTGKWLADELRSAEIRVFLSSSELAAGDNFSDEIKEALRDALELWLIASPHSLESEWVMTEWGAAWAMGKRVVPVLHSCSPQDLPERLAALHTISLGDVSDEISRLKTRTKNGHVV